MGNRTPLFSGIIHLGKAINKKFAKKFFYEPDGLVCPVFLFISHSHSGPDLHRDELQPESINGIGLIAGSGPHDKSNAITCVVRKDDLLNSDLLFINAELFPFLKG